MAGRGSGVHHQPRRPARPRQRPAVVPAICKAAGIGEKWTPRELRTSFVSLMSHRGISTEKIARLVGHSSTRTTEVIYRNPRELRQAGEKLQVSWSAQASNGFRCPTAQAC